MSLWTFGTEEKTVFFTDFSNFLHVFLFTYFFKYAIIYKGFETIYMGGNAR